MHTKRIAVGGVKGIKWTTTPTGPHRKSECITLGNILKQLGYAGNSREARKIIIDGHVQVDGIVRKDPRYGAGLMDVISIPKIKKNYRVVPVKNGLELKEASDKEAKSKLCRVIGKRTLPKGITQITLHDGSSIVTDKKTNVNDTVVIEMPQRNVKDILSLEVGNFALIFSGRHRGGNGSIKEITKGTSARKSLTTIGDIQTLTDYVFIIGKEKPQVEL